MNKTKKINKKKKKSGFWKGSGKFFLFLIVLYVLIYAINHVYKLNNNKQLSFAEDNIEIEGNNFISRSRILDVCGIIPGEDQPVDIIPENVASELMQSPFLKGISVTVRPPKRLNITMEEREPVAFIYGKGLNLIDNTGYIMPLPDHSMVLDLPCISGISENLGSRGEISRSEKALNAVNILNHIRANSMMLEGMISEVNYAYPRMIRIIMVRGGAEIRINEDNYAHELHILKNYMLSYLNWAEMKNIEYIDLRFDQQLIVKEKV